MINNQNSKLYVASTAFAEDKEPKNEEETSDLDFFLADEDDEKKTDKVTDEEGEDKKKKKKKKKNKTKKNKKSKHARATEEETAPAESLEPNPAEIAEDTRDDEEINGVLRYKYLLVGGGTASYAALKAIREADPEADVSYWCNQRRVIS